MNPVRSRSLKSLTPSPIRRPAPETVTAKALEDAFFKALKTPSKPPNVAKVRAAVPITGLRHVHTMGRHPYGYTDFYFVKPGQVAVRDTPIDGGKSTWYSWKTRLTTQGP